MSTDDSAVSSEDIDLGRAPLGVKTASALVRAVAANDDRVERHYLEVKSDLDLARRTDIAKIAKFILGAANRLPHVARAAFEGYGVMVIGASQGNVRGVPPIEVLELDKIIRRYLGASGPKWDVERVPVPGSDNEVLVVVVDPPKDGQDPFLCRKDGESLHDGRIYVRADGATREANAEEVDLLIRRGKYVPAPDVNFDVKVVGETHPIKIDRTFTLDAYVAGQRQRLLRALPRPESTEETPAVGVAASKAVRQMLDASRSVQQAAIAAGFHVEPETRTAEQYRDSIDRWEDCVREEWQDAVDELAGYVLSGVSLQVLNAAKVFFHDIEVKVHLEGDVRGIHWLDGEDQSQNFMLNLSAPPRAWGPVTRSPLDLMNLGTSQFITTSDLPNMYESKLDWDNSGSVNLTLNVGDLRPRQTFAWDDDELILVLPPTHVGGVRGTWEITARDHNEIYSGELSVQVGEPTDLTGMIRGLLELD